jgi:hypothetical protein
MHEHWPPRPILLCHPLLRKYFHRELASGMMKANANVAQTLYSMATSHPAEGFENAAIIENRHVLCNAKLPPLT